ncbi:MAG: helix-turn-helix transcriptional regulator [Oscillatoriaceae cyanobacterium Prado104]|jgi:transcriptional regulator with XRE-family HTH domain|nr:helix-turn-helix transcriptional regulator [Oscillatoriaceae cyanobacterium Prado104]
MPGFLDFKAVVEQEKLRPVRFTDTGRSRLGKILKAAREVRGWSIIETEIVTKEYEAAIFRTAGDAVPKDVGISNATVSRYERGKLESLDWRSLSLLCFVLKPKDPLTSETLEPTNALYIACEHPPYNDPKLYEGLKKIINRSDTIFLKSPKISNLKSQIDLSISPFGLKLHYFL